MKYKTLFRIICKGLGLYIMILGITGFLGTISSFLVRFSFPAPARPDYYWNLIYLVNNAIQFGIGAYLFFGGRRIVDLAIPGNRPYCPECGYDLTANVGDICPECGVDRRTGKPDLSRE